MRPHREEQIEMRVAAVRNGKRKIVAERRKQNEKERKLQIQTSKY